MLTLQRFTFAQPNNSTLDAPLDVQIEKGLQRSFMDLPHFDHNHDAMLTNRKAGIQLDMI